ncbi:MAG: transposase [Planctomycetota bacterium]
MGQRSRRDAPGTYHHIFNRGIARRPLFERRAEGRCFLAQLARRVRAAQIEVVAYSLMTTHFHLLVRSPSGEVSEAMRCATNAYSRWFNRCHRRDGPLFRGRFLSRRIDTLAYRVAVLRYIDQNPVHARIVADPATYALGSARRYCSDRPGPWLSRSWLGPYVDRAVPGDRPWHAKYREFTGRGVSVGLREMVEARLSHKGDEEDVLDELVSAAPPRILDWMQRKTRLAYRGRLLLPVSGASSVRQAVREQQAELESWKTDGTSRAPNPRAVLLAGLLRQLTGMSLERIAATVDVPETTARRYVRLHDRMTQEQGSRYAAVSARAASAAVADSTRDLRPA